MKFAPAIITLSGALALAACDQADEDTYVDAADTGETTVVTEEVPVTVPAEDGTTTTEDGSRLTIDGKDVDATIGTDGVKADIKVDGD